MLTRLLLCYSTNRRIFLLLSLASLAMLLLLAPIRKNSDSGGKQSFLWMPYNTTKFQVLVLTKVTEGFLKRA